MPGHCFLQTTYRSENVKANVSRIWQNNFQYSLLNIPSALKYFYYILDVNYFSSCSAGSFKMSSHRLLSPALFHLKREMIFLADPQIESVRPSVRAFPAKFSGKLNRCLGHGMPILCHVTWRHVIFTSIKFSRQCLRGNWGHVTFTPILFPC